MGDTFDDMDKNRTERKKNLELLEKKKLSDCRVIEEMNTLALYKSSSKRKGDRIMDRLNNSLNNNKHKKNKKE